MRSVLLVILSALALAGIFLGYWVSQPTLKVPMRVAPSAAVDKPPDAVPGTTMRDSEGGWLRERDSTGKLTTEFRGEHFEPRANGTIDVTSPIANFYLAGNQHLEVTGVTGNMVMKQMPNPGKAGFANSGPMSPPTHGRLDHVVLKMIDDTTAQTILTMQTRNVVFDNETFRISTEGYRDENGVDLTSDQVPVHIVGEESGRGHAPFLKQMEGRGLTVRWNDRDGRLELLEIAHGSFLVIGNASSPVLPGAAPKPTTTPLNTTAIVTPLAGMLASADPQAAGQLITPSTARAAAPRSAPRAGHPTVVYRASFYDNVRINQPDPSGGFDQVVIDNINQMDVDFRLSSGGSSTTRPATTSAPAIIAPAPASQPGTAPRVTDAVADASASAAETKPAAATQPAQSSEMVIHWTGRLFMTPLMTQPWSPLRPGEGAVKLIGQPMHMHRIDPAGGGFEDVRAASALYATAGDHVLLDRSRQFPSIFIDRIPPATAKDQRQTHVVSAGQVQYARDAQLARCIGPGFADVPMEADANAPPATMHATWTRSAAFAMALPAAGSQTALREGHLAGNVYIQSPRMTLQSDTLDLYFDQIATRNAKGPAGVQQTLKQVVATTKVFCQFTGTDGKKQSIEGNRLVLDTGVSQGKSYPSHVSAAGSVHALADDDLRADFLDVMLKPAPPRAGPSKPTTRKADGDAPPVELQEMVAWGNVVAKSKDGSIATGDTLTVTADGGKQHAVLASTAGARVISPKGNLVTGPEIDFDSGDGRAYIIGVGHMEALSQSSSTTQPAQKITVSWMTGALFDGAANRIDADGNVQMSTVDSRGFHDEGSADHARVDLQRRAEPDPAATQPAAQLASATQTPALAGIANTGAASSDSGQMNLFKDKEVVAITLEGNAILNSTLPGRDGGVEQQMVLQGPRVIVREIAPDGSRLRTVSVPAAGRMLVRDHREPGSGKKSDTGDLHGAVRFDWQRSLVYSKATQRADMTGDVAIRYDPSQGDPLPALINGDHVIAYFEEMPVPATTKPATAGDSSHVRLRLVSILGSDAADVRVTHGESDMKARRVDFDPANHMLTAVGTAQNPVLFYNGSTGQSQFERLDWDTLTWDPHGHNAILDYHPHSNTSTPKPKSK